METLCACVVLVLISASPGQTNVSGPSAAPGIKEMELISTSAPPETLQKFRPENETETNSTTENFVNQDMNKTETEAEPGEPGEPEEPGEPGEPGEPEEAGEPGEPGDPEEYEENETPIDLTTENAIFTDGNSRPTDPPDANESSGGASWGYVILVLILVLVLALCVILVHMRRVSRTYAFDLQLPGPSRSVEPIGSFEPVHLDDLDYQGHTTGFSVSVEANGAVLSPEDKEPNEEASQSNGLQTPPAPESGPAADQDRPDQDQPDQDRPDQDRPDQDRPDQDRPDQDRPDQDSSPVLFIEESEEEMNANNNNQLVHPGPFVEISLDEPHSPFGFSSAELQPFY